VASSRHGAETAVRYAEATVPKITHHITRKARGAPGLMGSKHLRTDQHLVSQQESIKGGPKGPVVNIVYRREDRRGWLKIGAAARQQRQPSSAATIPLNPFIAAERGFID
jgi:acetyl-CoA carboxylase carboxyltransferase component